MTDIERRLADINGMTESDFEKQNTNDDRIEQLEAMLEALLRGDTNADT